MFFNLTRLAWLFYNISNSWFLQSSYLESSPKLWNSAYVNITALFSNLLIWFRRDYWLLVSVKLLLRVCYSFYPDFKLRVERVSCQEEASNWVTLSAITISALEFWFYPKDIRILLSLLCYNYWFLNGYVTIIIYKIWICDPDEDYLSRIDDNWWLTFWSCSLITFQNGFFRSEILNML